MPPQRSTARRGLTPILRPFTVYLSGMLVLPLVLSGCVGVRNSASVGITSNPWRTQISAMQTSAQGQGASAQNAQTQRPPTTTYYVDCNSGSDAASGRSAAQAWKSLGRAASASLGPGEALLFKRGCRWDGTLDAKWSGTPEAPVTIGAYGEGALPQLRGRGEGAVVNVRGRHQVLEFLDIASDTPAPRADAWRCRSQPTGWRIGFSFRDGSQGNTVRSSRASGLTAGIHFEGGSQNKALYNMLVHNTVMSQNTPATPDDDSGAWGVLLNANDNEVAYNYFEGNIACSEDYGVEGASVELFKASRNFIHHNVSVNDSTFAELGGHSGMNSANNTFAYNLYAPVDTGGEMLVLRGSRSKWGANPGTRFYNNTGYQVTLGISCGDGCGPDILSARNNILVARASSDRDLLFADASFDEGNNLLWRDGPPPKITIRGGDLHPSSRVADPRFANPSGLDFRLLPGSPGRGAGAREPLSALSISADLDGTPIVNSRALDIGALQSKP